METSSKKTELTLLQKIVLLALDNKGWFGASEHKIKFGIAGAILFELQQAGRINISSDNIAVINPKSTNEVVLDRVLNLIKASKKRHSLRSWIQRIVYKKLLLRKTILKQLIQEKIISREEYSLMMIFYQTKFPILDLELKKRVQEDLYDKIVNDKHLNPEDLMLMVVMVNCRMVRKNFGGFIQYLRLRGKINEITQFRNPKNTTEETINILQTAISRAILASNVSIHV
ncbi:MAG: GPP34 family phosphoprotein [Bacteroidales bacterium]|nr:GPP34 family phosphoprotein [Bacteroidales bacterium]NCA74949.1 GPP34 family phosphoprotein [Alphaproteobacteria bacterium]